jgi:ribosomal protein L33
LEIKLKCNISSSPPKSAFIRRAILKFGKEQCKNWKHLETKNQKIKLPLLIMNKFSNGTPSYCVAVNI